MGGRHFAVGLLACVLAGCASSPIEGSASKYVGDGPKPALAYVDFAQLEYSNPLSLEDRAKLSPDDLNGLDQEAIDRIYARLTAGPIPDGYYEGKVFVTTGTHGNFEVDDLLWGYLRKMFPNAAASFNKAAQGLWKGKDFDRENRILRNRIASLELPKEFPRVDVALPNKLFPAKVYCGQSLLDSRRESIVIDYLFTDELPGYREVPDLLAGRRGLQVRDEIRMVRPGFYLGRAYVNRIFMLTFTLYNEGVARREGPQFMSGKPREDCWTGTQLRRISGSR